ncbi:MAG: DUF6494 family protein [Pseudomonadota bacterium]
MSQDEFNMSMRKFLKTVGITSQKEIEEAVRSAQESGSLPSGPVQATVVLTVEALGLTHKVEGQIELPSPDS